MQHDGRRRRLQHRAVHAEVVGARLRGAGEVPGRHEDRPRALLLGEVQLLLVGVDDLGDRDRLGLDVVGVDADDDRAALFARDLRGPRDELAGGRGIQSHVPLGGVHGVGDAETPRVHRAAEVERRIPVDLGGLTGRVVGPRHGHDVRRGIRDPRAQGRRGLGERGRRGQLDLRQRAVGREEGQAIAAAGCRDTSGGLENHDAQSRLSAGSSILRPSRLDCRPASARSTPRAPERRSNS